MLILTVTAVIVASIAVTYLRYVYRLKNLLRRVENYVLGIDCLSAESSRLTSQCLTLLRDRQFLILQVEDPFLPKWFLRRLSRTLRATSIKARLIPTIYCLACPHETRVYFIKKLGWLEASVRLYNRPAWVLI